MRTRRIDGRLAILLALILFIALYALAPGYLLPALLFALILFVLTRWGD